MTVIKVMRRNEMPRVIALVLASLLVLGTIAVVRAQEVSPFVSVTTLDSEAFPTVTLYLSVFNENGPVTGLTAEDFALREDGTNVPQTALAFESVADQPLSIALVIDSSTDLASLTNVQVAAQAVVDGMGPNDQTTLIAFFDEVEMMQDFTADEEELETAIAAMEAGGNRSAVNAALVQAISVAEEQESGRKVIFLVTDSRDNTEEIIPLEEIIEQAQAAEVSIFPVGYGARVDQEALADLARQTGGRAIFVPTADDVRTNLQVLTVLLRQGYRLTYQSSIEADEGEHDLSIRVTTEAGEAQTAAEFVAFPSQISVAVPDWDRVRGLVQLTALPSAPTPIISVEYLLDGQPLAEVFEPPYRFIWNSTTVEPGEYTLVVRARDSAGNLGEQATPIVVEMPQPLSVAISTLQEQVELGEQITIEATVTPLDDVERVDFLIDDNLLGVLNEAPYTYIFDSNAYATGTHLVAVRAYNELGQEVLATRTVEIIEPVPERGPIFSRLLSVVLPAVLLIGALLFMLSSLLAIARENKRRILRFFKVEIENLGNVPSRFALQADDPTGELAFQLSQSGAELSSVGHAAPATPPPAQAVQQPAPAPTATAMTMQEAAAPEPAAGGGAKESAASAGEKADQAKGMFDSIIVLFPPSIRQRFGFVDQAEGAVDRGKFQARQAQASTDRVKGVQEQAGGATPATPQQPEAQPAAAQPAAGAATVPAMSAQPVAPAAAPTVIEQAPVEQPPPPVPAHLNGWSQTPEVAPGESLTVDLKITPAKRLNQAQPYPFKVVSRSIELEGAPEMAEQGSVEMPRLSFGRRFLPTPILFVGSLIVILSGWFLLMRFGILS